MLKQYEIWLNMFIVLLNWNLLHGNVLLLFSRNNVSKYSHVQNVEWCVDPYKHIDSPSRHWFMLIIIASKLAQWRIQWGVRGVRTPPLILPYVGLLQKFLSVSFTIFSLVQKLMKSHFFECLDPSFARWLDPHLI